MLAESMLVVVLGSGMERQANGSTENEPGRNRPAGLVALLRCGSGVKGSGPLQHAPPSSKK